MEPKTQLEKWWDETFAPRKKDKLTALQIFLRRPHGAPNFADKRMQRGVQMAIAKKRRAQRLEFINEYRSQGLAMAQMLREAYLRRRGKRWRALVEEHVPRAFAEQMRGMGLGMEVGSGMGGKA